MKWMDGKLEQMSDVELLRNSEDRIEQEEVKDNENVRTDVKHVIEHGTESERWSKSSINVLGYYIIIEQRYCFNVDPIYYNITKSIVRHVLCPIGPYPSGNTFNYRIVYNS